jgi:hypothetical protein
VAVRSNICSKLVRNTTCLQNTRTSAVSLDFQPQPDPIWRSVALQGRVSDTQFLENKYFFWSPLSTHEVWSWCSSAPIYVCMCTCMYVHMYVCMYVCMCTYMYVNVRMYACTVCIMDVQMCIYVCVYECVCVARMSYMRMHWCMYVLCIFNYLLFTDEKNRQKLTSEHSSAQSPSQRHGRHQLQTLSHCHPICSVSHDFEVADEWDKGVGRYSLRWVRTRAREWETALYCDARTRERWGSTILQRDSHGTATEYRRRSSVHRHPLPHTPVNACYLRTPYQLRKLQVHILVSI